MITSLLIAALLATSADPACGNDDRAQLELDFATACLLGVDLELGPGRYDVTRKPSLAGVAIASLRFRCDREVRIQCAPGASLGMMGSALVGGESTPRAWSLMEIGGRVRVHGCAMDADGITGPTGEQTHLLQPIGPYVGSATGADLSWLVLRMVPTAYRAGDAIRIIGPTEATKIRGFTMEDITVPVGHRSGIGVQRNIDGLIGRRIRVASVRDAAIDYEATGIGANTGHLWEDLDLSRGPEAQGGVTMSIGGHAAAEGVTIRRAVIRDGGIYAVNIAGLVLEDVTILQTRSFPAVSISQASAGNRIVRSRLIRGGVGPVVHSYFQAERGPRDLAIIDSLLVHTGSGQGVAYESSTGLDWRGGALVVAAGRVCGLAASSASADVAGLAVTDVVVSCPAGAAFYQGDPYRFTVAAPTFLGMIGMP